MAVKKDLGLHKRMRKKKVIVMAEAGLSAVMNEVKKEFEKRYSSIKVTQYFASAKSLRSAIEQGAEVDILILPATGDLDKVEGGGFLVPESRLGLLSDRLVTIIHSRSVIKPVNNLNWLTGSPIRMIAIGWPGISLWGDNNLESLKALGLWDNVKQKVLCSDIAGFVPNMVEIDEAQAGICFKSCASLNSKVRLVNELPHSSFHEVFIDLARVTTGPNLQAGMYYWNFIQGINSQAIFFRHGYDWVKRRDVSNGPREGVKEEF